MKAPVAPEAVNIFRQAADSAAPAGERNAMVIGNLKRFQRARKGALIELRIGSGHGNLANVHHPSDLRLLQEADELLKAPVRMSDRVEGLRHSSCRACCRKPSVSPSISSVPPVVFSQQGLATEGEYAWLVKA